MAFITVTDAAGRVLFRRAATQLEIDEAAKAADVAEIEAQEAMERMAASREYVESFVDSQQ
jgi:hypothetical protein